jgi:ABC-2 type transport system permease protein
MWGSYLGLLMLGSVFVSIGIFASVITDNQIVSFIVSMLLCFIFYIAFEFLGNLNALQSISYWIQWMGIYSHYESISRGVLDTRDAIYFVSVITLFLLLTKTVFGSRKW